MDISKIGLEYARRFKDIEEGRDVFFSNFYSILDSLEEALVKKLKEAGMKATIYKSKPNVKKDIYIELYIRKSYADIWNKLNKDRNDEVSGIGLYFEPGKDSQFEFQAALFFYDKDGDLWKNEEDVKKCLVLPGLHDIRIKSCDKYFYVVVSSIGVEKGAEFNIESFHRETERLPAAFLAADECIARFIEKRKKGTIAG